MFLFSNTLFLPIRQQKTFAKQAKFVVPERKTHQIAGLLSLSRTVIKSSLKFKRLRMTSPFTASHIFQKRFFFTYHSNQLDNKQLHTNSFPCDISALTVRKNLQTILVREKHAEFSKIMCARFSCKNPSADIQQGVSQT